MYENTNEIHSHVLWCVFVFEKNIIQMDIVFYLVSDELIVKVNEWQSSFEWI